MNQDGGELGSAIQTVIQANIDLDSKMKLGWSIYPTPNDITVEEVTNDVINEKVWFALIGWYF